MRVDEALVRALLAEQHPDLADLSISRLSAGWDNVMFRLGHTLTVRVPHRALAADLIEHELRWLPVLGPLLPLPVPMPVRVGRPGCGFPWSWMVCPWLPGQVALDGNLGSAAALQLAGFLLAMHQPAPIDAPANPFRGVPLAVRADQVGERLTRLVARPERDALTPIWDLALAAPVWSEPPLWLHGDVHPGNVLIDDSGMISAIIDFGDVTSGDPASDLSVAWMLCDADATHVFQTELERYDAATWARARGWCVALALAFLDSPTENRAMVPVGRRALAALISEGR